MRILARIARSTAPARPRRRTRALAAGLSLSAACTAGPDAGTRLAEGLGALALVASFAVFHRIMVRRKRIESAAAAWRDAVRIAGLARAGVVGELEEWVARDLGAPVTSLLNNLAAARRQLARGDRARLPDVIVALDDARSDAERAALAIRRMGQLFGRGASSQEPLDLNAVAREALRLADRYAGTRGVALIAALDARLPPTRGDADQLLQVALGLVLWAVDHASTSRVRTVTVRTTPGEDGVELAVSDTGPAISEVPRARLFAPFSTTSGGLGVGLGFTRSIVEAHGGQVVAERPESGALFRVTLPACDAPPETRSPGAERA